MAPLLPIPHHTKPMQPTPLTDRTNETFAFDENHPNPYVQNWNVELQREIAHNLTVEARYVGNKGTKLYGGIPTNNVNIFENGILDAFNVTRAGGNAPLFDRIFNGLNVPGSGVVNGTTLTGSQALRRWTSTQVFLANGDVGGLANFLNTNTALTSEAGGFLRRVGLPENSIVVNPQFGSVTLQGNNNNSIYHSFQTQVTKRLSNGLAGQFSYTFSKALGDTGTRDNRNRRLSRGI